MKHITPADHFSARIDVHPSQRQPHIQPVSALLHVITCITNPERFRARPELYQAFEKMCADAGAVLWTVEIALRDRHHEVTHFDHPRHIQLRSPAEMWMKEDPINLVIRHHLPADAEYIAWIDADVQFARPDWVVETIHQLQHFSVVQMFSHAQDVSPVKDLGNGAMMAKPFSSFMYSYVNGVSLDCWRPVNRRGGSEYGGGAKWWLWHSGYAWAATRRALNDLGGLGDIAILGSADHHMAAALIGEVRATVHNGMHASYKRYWDLWQERALDRVRRNVGYVPGLLLHYWHGPKGNRGYVDRWKILVEEQFNHEIDLYRDIQGLYCLTERNYRLRDRLRQYFRQRNEDSIEC